MANNAGSTGLVWLAVCASLLATAPLAGGEPVLRDPKRFRIELFADFKGIPSERTLSALHLNLTRGENGFKEGLYVTTGPGPNDGDLLVHVAGRGKLEPMPIGIIAEATIFARGQFGEGLLISEPTKGRIHRLLPNGRMSVFADLNPKPGGAQGQGGAWQGAFGPTEMIYPPDFSTLIVSRGLEGVLLTIDPSGGAKPFSRLPLPDAFVTGSRPLLYLSREGQRRFGGAILTGTFSLDKSADPLFRDSIFVMAPDGEIIQKLASNLQGPVSFAEGPGGAFGTDFFMGLFGSCAEGFGGLVTVSPAGEVTPFLRGIDVAHVGFDSEGVFGPAGGGAGGAPAEPSAFVAEPSKDGRPGRVWRISVNSAPDGTFRRSDTDGSAAIDISDAVRTFGFLFLGGPPPGCPDAADSNDDGIVDISDGVFTLNWLFNDGKEPPAPGPFQCGEDPTADGLGPCVGGC